MQPRKFGDTQLVTSPFGLGCARIGGIFQNDSRGFLALLAVAFDAGINFFDTADMYSQGESERLIGKAFRRQRSQIVIASKGGYSLPRRRMFVAKLKPVVRPLISALKLQRKHVPSAAGGAPAQDFSPGYLRRAVEGSLRRLGTDYLDLYQLHSPPRDVIVREDWREELEKLKQAGKIRYYGVSCDTADAALEAARVAGASSLQLAVSALEHEIADRVLPELGNGRVAVIARECLANGLLVKPPEESELSRYFGTVAEQERRRAELAELRSRASAAGASLTTWALRYVNELPGVAVTLIGARSVAQLRGLLRALPRS